MQHRNNKRPCSNTSASHMGKNIYVVTDIIPQDFFDGLKKWREETANIEWGVAVYGAHRL